MIKVLIPSQFSKEISYVLQVVFEEYLGLALEIREGESSHYLITDGQHLLKIENHFSSKEEYLCEENIPKNIEWNTNLIEDAFPILYGRNVLSNEGKIISCGIDFFASAFFMLSRWEEYVLKDRDVHGRFPLESSLAFKENFFHLPVVNQYVKALVTLLEEAGFELDLKKNRFQLINTHDVDIPYKWKSLKKLGGRFKYLFNHGRTSEWFLKEVTDYVLCKLKIRKDPFDQFDRLMESSEAVGVKSYFFFMDYGFTPFDKNYRITDRKVSALIAKIAERKHHIGFHPSYELYNNSDLFKAGFKNLKDEIRENLSPIGRQHFLRFEVPFTWRIWEAEGMDWDSTLAYTGQNGFRCGTCLPFSVFDILNRQKLKLKERPLLFMEQSSIVYQKSTAVEMLEEAKSIMNQVKKYDGEFVLLWHNSNFKTDGYESYASVYDEILSYYAKIVE